MAGILLVYRLFFWKSRLTFLCQKLNITLAQFMKSAFFAGDVAYMNGFRTILKMQRNGGNIIYIRAGKINVQFSVDTEGIAVL